MCVHVLLGFVRAKRGCFGPSDLYSLPQPSGKRLAMRALATLLLSVPTSCQAADSSCAEADAGCSPTLALVLFRASSRDLGGTVTGLVSSGLTVSDGSESIAVSANGGFLFSTKIDPGNSFEVTVTSQPGDLLCFVQGGSGTATGSNNANIRVSCPIAVLGGVRWHRCTYGQSWNFAAGNCTATGSAGSNFGATQVQFCDMASTNACNAGAVLISGGGLSTLFHACDGMNADATYGFTTWRVATKVEMQNNTIYCANGPATPPGDPVSCNAGIHAQGAIQDRGPEKGAHLPEGSREPGR